MALFKNITMGITVTPVESECKGKFYRLYDSMYPGSRGEVVMRQEFRPLKSLSCPGCSECSWLEDELQEFLQEKRLLIEGNIEDGAMYRLACVNEERDWETGAIDTWDIAMVYECDRLGRFEKERGGVQSDDGHKE